MIVITLAKTKELLGIDNTDYDTEIAAIIPEIDSTVKQITRNNYNWQITGDTVDGEPYIEIASIFNYAGVSNYNQRDNTRGINAPGVIDDIEEYIKIGMLIEGDNIPADSYISELYTPRRKVVTLDSNEYTCPVIKINDDCTGDLSGAQIFTGITIGLQRKVAKGIFWLIGQTSTTMPKSGLSGRSFGPLSESFSSKDQEIDGRYGMPAWFVKSFPTYMGGH